jgi:ATP-dependent Lhr-like helicase
MHDEFDLPHLKQLLEELARGKIRYTEMETVTPSPLAAGLVWRQTDKHMYEDDVPGSGKRSGLDDDMLREVCTSTHLRPRLKKVIIKDFCAKTQRTCPGYVPLDSCELLEWIKERLLIPNEEWEDLLAAIEHENQTDVLSLLSEVKEKTLIVRLPGAETDAVVAIESLPRTLTALDITPGQIEASSTLVDPLFHKKDVMDRIQYLVAESLKKGVYVEETSASDRLAGLIGEWMRFYGPVKPPFICRVFASCMRILNVHYEAEKAKSSSTVHT